MNVYSFIILAHSCLNYYEFAFSTVLKIKKVFEFEFAFSTVLRIKKVFAFLFFFVGTLVRITESLLFDPDVYQRTLYIFLIYKYYYVSFYVIIKHNLLYCTAVVYAIKFNL